MIAQISEITGAEVVSPVLVLSPVVVLSEVLVDSVLDSSEEHDVTNNAILTIKTNQDNIFFILFLFRIC